MSAIIFPIFMELFVLINSLCIQDISVLIIGMTYKYF